MADAVEKHSSAKATIMAGVPTVLSSDTSGIAAAVALAKTVDEVILAVGTDLTWAHEEHDAQNITFTDAQVHRSRSLALSRSLILSLTYFITFPFASRLRSMFHIILHGCTNVSTPP